MNLKRVSLVVAIGIVMVAFLIMCGFRRTSKAIDIIEVIDPLNPSLTALLPESASQVAQVHNARVTTNLTKSDIQQLAKLVGRIQGIRYEILSISPLRGSSSKFEVRVPDHFITVEWINNQWLLVSISRYLEVAN